MKNGVDFIGVGVGALIFNDRDELLLMKRGQAARNERGCWEIPGGGIEFGELLHEAVVREVKEELGVDIQVVTQLHTIDHIIPQDNQHWLATPFLVRVVAGEPAIQEPDKCDELAWFVPNALPSPLAISTKLNLESYQRYLTAMGSAQ